MLNKKALHAYIFGLCAWALAIILSLKFGATTDADIAVIVQLRLPRVLLASAVGIGLSVAGASLQALFSNPLCEPYTLGISSGAALGAVFGASLGFHWIFGGLTGTAFAGALLFTALLFVVAHRPGVTTLSLLLAGVMLGFLGSSLVALWMALSDTNGIQGALLWLLGDLSRARMGGALFTLAAAFALTLALWLRWRELDALLMGEEGALTLGIAVGKVRASLIFTIALLVAICVSASGMIGFIGLVIPHFVRRLVGSLHLQLLPLCAIWGAAALTAADVTARVLARPYDLPVGIVTALVGAPLFLWILFSRREAS
ncbi:MAG TPA: iron ABC transporter permease [Bdellovibrionota bacterium]|nr:iron ABC transporter permease [Bdellovibrionota bacterium]